MQRLCNPVRRYSWGTTSAIPDLLGVEPDGEPQAELWLGAHADSPSVLEDGRRLDDAVRADPQGLLGERVSGQFGPRLPFLLKVLSAQTPLSLQVHPSPEQAAAGFAAEEAEGVAADAPHRRYHDEYHKPEMVVALTPFEVLCGLRPNAEVAALLATLDVADPTWGYLLSLLEGTDDRAHERALRWLLGGDPRVPALLDAVVHACATTRGSEPSLRTVLELAEAFPGDPGVLVSLLLHRVSLAPGDALYLPAGNVHAYLSGTALEVMASSDNVLRAGLTSKHVDVEELLRLVHFTPRAVPWVTPERRGPLTCYRPGTEEFELVQARLDGAQGWVDVEADGPRVVLVLDGVVEAGAGSEVSSVRRGESLFVADADGPLRLRGTGCAVVVAVPVSRAS